MGTRDIVIGDLFLFLGISCVLERVFFFLPLEDFSRRILFEVEDRGDLGITGP